MKKRVKLFGTIFFACCLAFALNMTAFAAKEGECIIWFDEEAVDAAVNGIPIENGTWIQFADYDWDEYEITFTEKKNNYEASLEGIYVIYGEREFCNYRNQEQASTMTCYLPDRDLSYDIVIEAVTWDDIFDNEMIVLYDDTKGNVFAEGKLCENGVVNEFLSVDMNFTFEYPDGNNKPYAIDAFFPNGYLVIGQNGVVDSEVYRYSPAMTNPFYLRVYWTQEEYEYAKMEYNTDSETYIEFGTVGNGEIKVPSQTGTLRSKSYENYQMFIISNSMTQMKVQLIPEAGEDVSAIYFDGELATGYALKNNILTLNKQQLATVALVEVEFTERAQKFEPNYIIGNGSAKGCPEKEVVIHIGDIFKGNYLDENEFVSLYFYDSDVSYKANVCSGQEKLNADEKVILVEQDGNYNDAYGWKVAAVSTKVNPDGTKEIRIDCIAAVPATIIEKIDTTVRWRKLLGVEIGEELPKVEELAVKVNGGGIEACQQGTLLIKGTQAHVDAGYITEEVLMLSENGYIDADKYSEEYRIAAEDVFAYSFWVNADEYYTFDYANGTDVKHHVVVSGDDASVISAITSGNTYPGTTAQICLELGTVSEFSEKIEEAKKILLGDVNDDGVIDTSDAQAIFNHFMGSIIITDSFGLASADANEDGTIDTSDAQMAFQIFMGN